MKAILRNIRISPKKANLVAGMVRGQKVSTALNILQFTPKKGAKIMYKVIHSAASNAKQNFNQKWEDLIISRILVTQGTTLKRSIPISRGRMHPLLKKTSHITVDVVSATPTPETKKETKTAKVTKTAAPVKTPKIPKVATQAKKKPAATADQPAETTDKKE